MNHSETRQDDFSAYWPFKWKLIEVLLQGILQDCIF